MKANYVFVYGTLKRGFGNHGLLNRLPVAEIIAEMPYQMISLGAFPALMRTKGEQNQIVGEVYSINERDLERLDHLEGYPDFYDRDLIDLRPYGIDGYAYFYYIKEWNGRLVHIIENGNWQRG